MERFASSCVAIALMAAGLCMVVWPEWVAGKNRDEGDQRPLSAGEIWTTRAVGIVFVVGGGYALYALWTGVSGAEFFPA